MFAAELPFQNSIGGFLAAHALPKPAAEVLAFLDDGCWGLAHLSTTLTINPRPRLVGRELESIRLLHALDAVSRENAATVVTISGSAGAGKTRLIEEALTIATVGGFEGRIFSVAARAGDPPNATVARLLSARFGLDHRSPRLHRYQLLRGVSDLFADERVEDVCYFLGGLLDLDFEGTPLTRALTQHAFHAEIALQAILCELFAADCAMAPICIAIDDLQDVDADSLGKLMALTDDLRPGSLLICSAQPSFFARHEHFAQMGSAEHEHIELSELEQEDVQLLLKDLVGPCIHDEQELDCFFSEAGRGNPGLIQELVRELWALGALQPLADESACYFDAECLGAARLG